LRLEEIKKLNKKKMHGRLKVRTTEEQEQRKRIEREKKLKAYQIGMSECFKRVENKEYDMIGMKISEEILSSNPDIQTLWNLRKNTVEKCVTENKHDEQDLIKLFSNEISLTDIALKKNPKSYCCWHHRRWCFLRAEELNYANKSQQLSWSNEKKLCDIFLELDSRNFHCWRHRLFLIENEKINKLDELAFTYEKICSNFSNYSAWHYRSKLLESLYAENQIDFDVFKKELNLIENAIFTDPNDQAAWIYEKWLLLEHQRSSVKELSFDISKYVLSFKFTKELNLNNDLIILKLNGECLMSKLNSSNIDGLKWTNDKDNDLDDSKVWSSTIPRNENLVNLSHKQNQLKIMICVKNSGASSEILLERDVQDSNLFVYKSKFQIKDLHLDNELIENHLKNILELSTLESDKSKWCLLTAVELMCIINYNQYKNTIFEYLDKLVNEIDVTRRNFYLDFKQRIIANNLS
jgi:geranylgeranyl transferase type-2 subunit alpha